MTLGHLVGADVVSEARRSADSAAAHAGVRIETVDDFDGLVTVLDVISAVWRPMPEDPPITLGVLRAMTHVGNYCAIAWDGPTPVGVCLGFLGLDGELALHSHIAGVIPRAAGRHVGRALKLDQRAWALERGVGLVTWTFDPLIRRNAYFNTARLGALPTAYLVDFYGDMADAINAGQHTDRLSVSWRLASPTVIEICSGTRRSAATPALDRLCVLLDVDERTQEPVRRDSGDTDATSAVRIPADIEAIRVSDPALAKRWRFAVRDVLGGLMNEGWVVRSVGRDGYYRLERGDEGVDR